MNYEGTSQQVEIETLMNRGEAKIEQQQVGIPEPENEVRAEGIEKIYVTAGHRLVVLNGMDLVLKKGEMVAIVGASGTGKTTLLHVLGTLDRPTGGRLLYHGVDVFALGDAELSALRNKLVGFVFQFHHLLPEFTAFENVLMPGLIAGLTRKQLADEIMEMFAQVGLADRAEHRVGELSGGEQQRVALARALVMKPSLLLADEPTGNLDVGTGRSVFELIQRMNQIYSLTTVIVTHNLDLAREMDRCMTLAEGRLVELQ